VTFNKIERVFYLFSEDSILFKELETIIDISSKGGKQASSLCS
jgi:hypothetical protein